MATPFYLEGTQTAGLFDQPEGTQAATPYVPGSGMPLYAESYIEPIPTTSVESSNPSFTGGTFNGYVPPEMAAQYGYDTAWTMLASGQLPSQDSSFLNIGQQTPEEIARNEAIMNAPIDRTTSGGGTGGQTLIPSSVTSGGRAGTTAGGQPSTLAQLKAFSGTGGNQVSPNFSPMQYQPGQMPQYQSPQGQMGAPQGSGMLQMQQASPQQALGNYFNTPGYQLLFGGNPDPNQSAAQRFQHSPGYDYAVSDALDQVQRNAASRGLLSSGRVMRDMTDRAQNMALQDYGNWWNRQNQTFNTYQNQLAGLASGPTGAQQAYQTGQNQAGLNMQTGSNIGSLFGNQGTSGLSGMVNTGAAQAGNIMNAGNVQAQVGSMNQSAQTVGNLLGNIF